MNPLRDLLPLLLLGTVPACAFTAPVQPLATDIGLGGLIHPLQKPEAIRYPDRCQGRPDQCCKEHVYVFGVNGLNFLCSGNFNGMMGYLRGEGFQNSYFAQLHTTGWIPAEVRKIRRTDPQARVVLIGFSCGANLVRGIANDLNQDGTPVDLLVYLVGDFIFDKPESKPANVRRIVNIRGHGLIFTGGNLCHGEDIEGARNVNLKCRHILAPSRRETLELLMEELLELACTPAGESLPPTVPAGPTAP